MPEIKPFVPVPNVIKVQTQKVAITPETPQTPSTPPAPQIPPTPPPPGGDPEPMVDPTASKVEKKEEFDSQKFAALTRKEKEILQRTKELRRKEELLEQERLKYRPFEEAFKSPSKLEAIKKLGISYEDITNEVLTQGQPTPEQLAELKAQEITQREIEAFKKEQQRIQEEQTQNAYQQALTQIHTQTKSLVEASDKYPLVKITDAFDTVTSLIEQTYHKSGELLSIEDAVSQVEKYLEEKALEVAKLEKIRSKLIEAPKPPPETPVSQPTQPKTLTHQTMATPPAARPESYAERRRRAEEIFYGRR